MQQVLFWQDGKGELAEYQASLAEYAYASGGWKQGWQAWNVSGVRVSQMGGLPVAIHTGSHFDNNSSVIVPKDQSHLAAIWCYCKSPEFNAAVRRIDQSLKVTNASLVKVPFDLERWQRIAAEEYPNGLPQPHSDDPTQWLFKGHPKGSTDPLQVAVARLLGYRWPDQEPDNIDSRPNLQKCGTAALGCLPSPSQESQAPAGGGWSTLPATLQEPGCLPPQDSQAPAGGGWATLIDEDGIVPVPGVRSEEPAADRLREVLRVDFSLEWSASLEDRLLVESGMKSGTSLDDWLRNAYFEQHCKRFHTRPFIWHIWDGRKDGFSALVNYHKLTHKALENLTYSYLGDWITAQSRSNQVGADLRLAAAQALQEKLKLILAGEPPYDIFVRWKPLHEQSIGWNPDLNDGVRMNIRPFIEADILRKKPNIKWTKDRGKEPQRDKDDFRWFWNGDTFVGDRVNDVHLTNAEKQAARSRKGGEN